ncbi:MAG TPA: segregation/condensation protein A [Gemmatales bacterium]|nr:segregation/condensation protein A [Gemmatales bacterium]
MSAMVNTSDYRVELPTFRGPLDLQLYLVKKHEVDILDIPIHTIAQSFLRYLEVIQLLDIEAAGDFLVLASTLMEIKSRMLLPREPEPEEAAEAGTQAIDPRADLVKQLLAYRRFREAAERLEQLAAQQACHYPRGYIEKPVYPLDAAQQPVQPVELWDLVSAFDRLLRATLSHQKQAIIVDDTPQHIRMAEMLAHLQKQPGPVAFETLFTPPHTKARLIGQFLALLELIKLQRVYVEQADTFGTILVTLLNASLEGMPS